MVLWLSVSKQALSTRVLALYLKLVSAEMLVLCGKALAVTGIQEHGSRHHEC